MNKLIGSTIRKTIQDIKKVREITKEINWKEALPFGSTIRETIKDIKTITGK